jgi:hypothetical protein
VFISFEMPKVIETREEYLREHARVEKLAREVSRQWPDTPSERFGASRLVCVLEHWKVITDVWKSDDWRGVSQLDWPMVAMIKDGRRVRCMRDLELRDVEGLQELDTRFPDSDGWVKFINYPPFVWWLHVHIQRPWQGRPKHNVYCLSKVIRMLRQGQGAVGDLLVQRYPS